MSDDHKIDKSESEHAGYEKRDVNIKETLIATAIIVIFLTVCIVWLFDIFVITKEDMVYDMSLKPVSVQLEDLRAKEQMELTTYGVADTTKHLYRIPIEKAMELIVSESASPQGDTAPKKAK